MYGLDAITRALALLEGGATYSAVATLTGISRSTLRRWKQEGFDGSGLERHRGTCLLCAGYTFPVPHVTAYSYAYLLGLYLGDGSLTNHPKGVFRLRLYLDRKYPVIVSEAAAAMPLVMPASRVAIHRAGRSEMDVPGSYSRHWRCLFPQHGPGMKHTRTIAIEAWQRHLLDRYPWRFLRGLIHSDGCRHINTIRHPKRTYRYPRYNFTNRSDDIRDLFCEYCDRVGVEWRVMNRWNISVAKRDSVALMDRFIGPKC